MGYKDIIVKTLDVCKWILICFVTAMVVNFVGGALGWFPSASVEFVNDILIGNAGVVEL